ncbi:MAG: cupin domain-containing protein [Desulfovibrio sp.]|jgi:mannose-6-phosphate isomerase-like protein (cupin superfamily)|nr:cupin domain-containing protein [Desulfovibrio sp.]MDR3362363.1 cupin domain-containing protein [Desulfovibrio sp.]
MPRTLIAFVLCSLFIASPVFAQQLYPKKELKTWDREKVGGGEGTLYGKFSFTRNDTTKEDAIKEIGWMTLQPGASIGMHKHENNEDAYIIVKGKGVFTDSTGKETRVKAGDITIARKGESHALKNTGKKPLIFLDVVAAQQ